MSEICYEPSQIFQPSRARAAPSWLGPPIRLLRSCPVFDALGVGREALRLGVGWLWCGGLHGSRCPSTRWEKHFMFLIDSLVSVYAYTGDYLSDLLP